MSVIRLLLLGACIAAGWLAVSLTASAPSASAATPLSAWGFGDGDNRDDAGLLGILDSVESALDEVAEPVTEPVANTTARLGSAVQSTVETTIDTTTTVLDTVASTVDETVGTTTEIIETVLPDGVLPDGVLPGDTPLSVVTAPADGVTAATVPADSADAGETARNARQLTAALWPLNHAPEPWSSRQLILMSAGALTASGSSTGGTVLCDVPFVERWLAANSGLSALSSDDRAPSAPTYDTDCTPD